MPGSNENEHARTGDESRGGANFSGPRGRGLIGHLQLGTNLREANLVRANVAGTELRGPRLRRACLVGVNLRNANLSGADLRDTIAEPESLRTVIVDSHTQLSDVGLTHRDPVEEGVS